MRLKESEDDMSDMDEDGEFWIRWWMIIVTGVVILVTICCAIITCHTERMAKLGYEERQCDGSSSTIWVYTGNRL